VVVVVIGTLAALVVWLVVRFWPTKRAKDELHWALHSHDYASAGQVIKHVSDDMGRKTAGELMVTTIRSLVNRESELRDELRQQAPRPEEIGPFPLRDRINEHLAEIEGKSPEQIWDKVGAILMDLDLGAVGEPEGEIQKCITALRDELGIEEDMDEVNWIVAEKRKARRARIREAKDYATTSQECDKAWKEVAEMTKRYVKNMEDNLLGTLRDFFEHAEASGQPREKLYENIGAHLGDETEFERNAVARFLVEKFVQMGEIDILRDFLLLVQAASKSTGERASQVSQTLATAQQIASERRKETQLDDEKRRLSFVAEICGIYSELWLPRGKFLANLGKPMEEMLALLDMPQLAGIELVRNLKALYSLFQKTLGEFRLAEDSIPLRLETRAVEDAREKAIEDMLGEYAAKHGVASVLKYIADQPVFPLVPFLKAVRNAQKELSEQAKWMEKVRISAADEERRMLFVPDESILNALLHKIGEAVEAELKDRRSALGVEIRNDRIYIEEGAKTITLRIAVKNEPSDRARVGDAWNVRLVASPPLESKTLAPAAGYISHILPWENNVIFDLRVISRDELKPDELDVKLKVNFDDLAQRDQVKQFLTTVMLIPAERYPESKFLEYDELVQDELQNAAGNDQELRRRLETALKIKKGIEESVRRGLGPLVNVQEVINELAESSDIDEYIENSVWAKQSPDEKKVLFALTDLLTSMPRAHVRSTELSILLLERYPMQLTNWNRLIRGLTGKKLIIDENGLYRFGSKLVQRWIAKHEGAVTNEISGGVYSP